MSIAIKVENLSKAYQLGEIGTGTISRDLERYWAKLRGKEDPFLRIGESNDRTIKGESNVVWSLKDINFEIEQGDAVGIIGRNGAGKSTLLKILSRVTSPTTGSVKVKGRVASLLEVGTGFHPELTGRENIFLNGVILGMRKTEIKKHFDEMVDFSGVERYIDTPVKRYSSGMYVRLAFAVAAHLESEILIVDEVLAVGDAEFQKKCLGKMSDVSKGEGRTVLFVSHNLQAAAALCNQGIILENGKLTNSTDIESAIKYYNSNLTSNTFKNITELINSKTRRGSGETRITYVESFNGDNEPNNEFITGETVVFKIDFVVNKLVERCAAMVVFMDGITGNSIASTGRTNININNFKLNETIHLVLSIPQVMLQEGTYNIKFWLGDGINNFEVLDDHIQPLVFKNIGFNSSGIGAVHLQSFIDVI